MDNPYSKTKYSQFIPQKTLIYLRGFFMLLLGGLISAASIIAPGVYILSGPNGWLPVAAMILISVGLLECYDTFISRHSERFVVNLQFAIMDTVFGAIILFELHYDAFKLSILIAAFLVAKGLFRFIAAYAGHFPHSKSTLIGGIISFLLGMLLWVRWPSTSVGFVSFCLSADIALRGWALINFGWWLGEIKKQQL